MQQLEIGVGIVRSMQVELFDARRVVDLSVWRFNDR